MADRILLVEDDIDIREEVAEFLRDEGYEVAIAHNGCEALELLRAGERPCMILLDLMMPEMDGWTFRAEQLKDPMLADVPVVIVSGTRDVASIANKLAVAAYLVKPFRIERLLAIVQQHC
jgi:CheY-like chemotaxis protein